MPPFNKAPPLLTSLKLHFYEIFSLSVNIIQTDFCQEITIQYRVLGTGGQHKIKRNYAGSPYWNFPIRSKGELFAEPNTCAYFRGFSCCNGESRFSYNSTIRQPLLFFRKTGNCNVVNFHLGQSVQNIDETLPYRIIIRCYYHNRLRAR